MAELGKRAKHCPADLTDEESERIKPILPKLPKGRRKPSKDTLPILDDNR